METVCVFLSVLFVSGVCQNNHLVTTAPEKIQAVTGSCVRIPCRFKPHKTETMLDSRAKVFGVWIKNGPKLTASPNNVIFNSANTNNIYSGEITGNLQEANCTTVFYNINTSHTDKYSFRIETKSSFRATDICNSVYINVTDSPPSPTLDIPCDLKEAVSITLTCSAPTPCPDSAPRLTWNFQQDPRNELEENSDGTFTTKIKHTFILSDSDDRRNVSCSASYPVNEGQEKTMEKIVSLSVSYAPKDTVASISGSEGHQVNMTCSSRANPSVRFSWFKKNLDKNMTVAEGADLSVTFADGDVYFCEAFNAIGRQRSDEIQLTEKSRLWEPIVGGIAGFVVLICFVIIFVCYLKSKSPSVPQTQRPAGGDHVDPQPDGENIHYGVIDFSKRRNEASSSLTPQDRGQQQDTVYAQINVSTSTEDHEDIYAQVKKN